jgi:hypothetical protein
MKRTILFWVAAVLLAAGCATAPAVIEKQEVAVPAGRAAAEALPETVPRPPDGRELLLEGARLLILPDRPEPAGARPFFLSLIQLYPESRWRPAAEAFIRLIDEREAFRERGLRERLLADTAQADRARAVQEDELLRKTVRELTERLERQRAELLSLAKDNEQLKQDIQRMKTLEIELEKRERSLR